MKKYFFIAAFCFAIVFLFHQILLLQRHPPQNFLKNITVSIAILWGMKAGRSDQTFQTLGRLKALHGLSRKYSIRAVIL